MPTYADGPREEQVPIFPFVCENPHALIEAPTGSGKTVVQRTIAMAMARATGQQVFWIVPTKALVEQISREFCGVTPAFGRNDHTCLFALSEFNEQRAMGVQRCDGEAILADPDAVRADAVATIVCNRCPHYIDADTGQTVGAGCAPCPYYQQKHEIRHAEVVVSTMSFYIYTHLFGRSLPAALIIDEVHQLPRVVQYSLSYDITDYHLDQSATLLERIGADDVVREVRRFRNAIRRISRGRNRRAEEERLLDDDEIMRLIAILDPIDTDELGRQVVAALSSGLLNANEDREALRRLEVLLRDLRKYVHAFMMSVEDGERRPLNYTCSFYRQEEVEEDSINDHRRRRVRHKLVVHSAYVAPLIRKCLLAPLTAGFSATIGDEDIFGFISGIRCPILRLGSSFPIENRRLYMPTDTPSLHFRQGDYRRRKNRELRRIVRACEKFSDRDVCCLVIVVSEDDRTRFRDFGAESGLDVMTYGANRKAKDALRLFKEGQGSVLLGTAAHYAQGIDLPRGMAPVIFVFQPGFSNTRSPLWQFMVRRFGERQARMIENFRMQQQALQVSGRNVRTSDDLGATVFIDQRFRKIVFPALPDWMQAAYRRDLDWAGCMSDICDLLDVRQIRWRETG